MANSVPHTIQLRGIYHFNYRVSSQMKAIPAYADRDAIRFSLRTRDRATAMKRAAAEVRKIEMELKRAGEPEPAVAATRLTTGIRKPLTDAGIKLIGRQYEDQFFEDHPLDQDFELEANQWDTDFGYVGGFTVEFWHRRRDLLLDKNRRAKRKFHSDIVGFATTVIKNGSYDADSAALQKLYVHLTEVAVGCINKLLEIAANRETGAAPAPLSLSSGFKVTTVAALVEHYASHYPKRTALISKLNPALRAWQELSGIEDVDEIKAKDVRAFARDLEKLPARYGMRFPGLTLRQAVVANAKREQPYELLAEKTIREGYIGPLKSVFSAALHDELISSNPFHGVRLAEVGRATEDKRNFRTHELNTLFQHPIWTGCHSNDRRNVPGAMVIEDEYYWAPLIALFTGMRADEIADLLVADVHFDHALPHIAVNGTKSKSAVRKIPLHPALAEMGFADYLTDIRASGSKNVFPDWKAPKGKTKSAAACQRNFNERIIKRGAFDNPKPTFHSFRQTLKSEMLRNKLTPNFQNAVMGHAQERMDKHYYNPDLQDYHQAFIEAVRFDDVDLSHLKKPPKSAKRAG